MKWKIISLFVFAFCVLMVQAKDIELEPRIGVTSAATNRFDMGFHIGGMVSFGLSDRFAIQPGVLMNVVETEDTYDNIGVAIPVYASWRVPLKKVNLRLNAGPYMEFKGGTNVGASLEAGVEYKQFYTGVAYFQDILSPRSVLLNLSFGYKFKVCK